MGSVTMSHQLAFQTPGSSPKSAFFLKQRRHMPNRLKKARGRPQKLQRLYPLTLNLGFLWAFTINEVFAIIVLILPEGHSHLLEQGSPFVVGFRGCHNGDVHSADAVDLVVVDLGK